jgi:hypothetical protein
VEIEAARDGAIVHSSQVAAPGWRIDGAAASLRDGPFLAFRVDEGRSVVTLTYAPRSFSWSCLAALAGVAVLLVAAGPYRLTAGTPAIVLSPRE